MTELWMWGVAVASLIGVEANIRKKQWCFLIWAFTNATWAIYDIHKTAYPQAALQFVYFMMSLRGIYKWRTRKEED